MTKEMFSIRGITLEYDASTEGYIVKKNGVRSYISKNPIEAWSVYIDTVDTTVRKQIGDMLEKQGKNRYTGLGEIKIE